MIKNYLKQPWRSLRKNKVQLISRDFLKLVLIAIIIATPVAWWAMSKWLLNFEYG